MKVVLGLLVAFGVLAYVGQAYAADPAPAPAQKEAKKEKAVRGEVVKVEGNKLTIKGKDNKEIVIATDDKTEVMIEGAPGKLADLKAGQKVVITPAEGTATKIQVPKTKQKKDKVAK